jgi:SagB-type dehydrogenase family enzyme
MTLPTRLHPAAATPSGRGAAAPLPLPLPLPAGAPATGDVLARIAARRSLRRYRDDALGLPQLASILRAMAAPPPVLADGLHIHLVSHRVQALARAAWAYDAQLHALRPGARHDDATLERRSRAAALDQQVIGDAAVVFVLTLDRATLEAAADGPARAYRHAFIEAGLIGERLYLQAQALGLGVCAVGAFYDDEVAALVGVDPARHWPLHVAALGVPA